MLFWNYTVVNYVRVGYVKAFYVHTIKKSKDTGLIVVST